ncbi:MAG: 7-cyano-7-deazaguanine synthase [Isosphaeraceae bacterium]
MNPANELAVLISGGLDSAILLGDSARRGAVVHPIYVREGLRWESAEVDHLRRYLAALPGRGIRPLHMLEQPLADLLAGHWSVDGDGIPDASTPDSAVFLPARNVLLLAQAMLWCHLHRVPRLALAVLKSNPFPDATPAFFDDFSAAVNRGIGSRVEVVRPFAGMGKEEVMELGRGLPLQWTFSCIRPVGGVHCGACNKCHERREAFLLSGLADPTPYAGGA